MVVSAVVSVLDEGWCLVAAAIVVGDCHRVSLHILLGSSKPLESVSARIDMNRSIQQMSLACSQKSGWTGGTNDDSSSGHRVAATAPTILLSTVVFALVAVVAAVVVVVVVVDVVSSRCPAPQ